MAFGLVLIPFSGWKLVVFDPNFFFEGLLSMLGYSSFL